MSQPPHPLPPPPPPDSADRVVILCNPYSGQRDNRRRVAALAEALERRGLRPLTVWRPEELTASLADAAFRRACRCLVAAGGDGTLSMMIDRCADLPVAMLPLGTENLFAKQFDHSGDPETLARMIHTARTTTIDLGLADGRRFLIVASAGFDGDAAHRLAAWRAPAPGSPAPAPGTAGPIRRVSRLSYIRPILASIMGYDFPPMTVEADGRTLRGALTMVFNIPRYGFGFTPCPDGRHDDGLLDYVVFERPGVISHAIYALAVWGRLHRRLSDVHVGRARCIRLTAEKPIPVEIDGDAAGFTPRQLRALPHALRLVVPPSNDE